MKVLSTIGNTIKIVQGLSEHIENKIDFYSSGGWPSSSSMVYLDQFSKSWNLAESQLPRMRHCLVTMDNGNIVLIGGYNNGHGVDMFDVNLEKWMAMPNVDYYSDR